MDNRTKTPIDQNGRSQSQQSGASLSKKSGNRSVNSKLSRCLSQLSQTSKKSVKSINASLERVHTFGMSSIHKSKYDLEKIDH